MIHLTPIRFLPVRRALLISIAALAAFPVHAVASGEDVLRDCAEDGDLDRRYSQEEYRDARRSMPADLDEYSDCRDVIRRAELAAAGGTKRSGNGGSAVAGVTPAARRKASSPPRPPSATRSPGRPAAVVARWPSTAVASS